MTVQWSFVSRVDEGDLPESSQATSCSGEPDPQSWKPSYRWTTSDTPDDFQRLLEASSGSEHATLLKLVMKTTLSKAPWDHESIIFVGKGLERA